MRLPRVRFSVEWVHIPPLRPLLGQRFTRPRISVRSLLIVVAVAALILSLVAYERRLRGLEAYHEAKCWEHIVSAQPGTSANSRKLPDGTWSPPYLMTPQAQWHMQMKETYRDAIIRTNQLVVVLLLISVFLGIAGKVVLTQLRKVRRGNQERL